MSKNRFIVIMAGGRGERFWPQSRLEKPKHLLPVVGDKPMLTQTVERVLGLVEPSDIFIITNAEQAAAVREICPMIPAERVIPEPVGRDTAPAVALAAKLVEREDPEAVFCILPADHVIHDTDGFQKLLSAAFVAAIEKNGLFTIGIQPEYPATGYGYIQKASADGEANGQPVFSVKQFVEKPDLETAEKYLASGEYYWNAGMFVWTVQAIKTAYAALQPELWDKLSDVNAKLDAGATVDEALKEVYPGLEKISVDYAILEKADNVYTMPSCFDWDDVGEWPAVARHYPKDENENVKKGSVLIQDAKGNIVLNNGGPFTAVLGVENLIVVQTPDATLICPRDKAQEIKKLVASLKNPDTEHLL